MEALELNGVQYKKASSVARELGYTSDYVGQLCRAGKVDAQLVGRSWYVNEQSIHEHKKSRYRSNTAKTVSEFKRELEVRHNDTVTESNSESGASSNTRNFYTRTNKTSALYEEDRSELIPTLKRLPRSEEYTEIEVHHADEKSVPVKKTKESYTLEASELPKIRFKGEVSVEDEPDESDEPETKQENKAAQKPKKPSHTTSTKESPATQKVSIRNVEKEVQKTRSFGERVAKKGVSMGIHAEDTKDAMHTGSIKIKRNGVVAMRVHTLRDEEKPQELSITAEHTTPHQSGRYTFLYITASLLLALALSAGFVLLESSVVSTGDSIDTRYSFNFSTVIESFRILR